MRSHWVTAGFPPSRESGLPGVFPRPPTHYHPLIQHNPLNNCEPPMMTTASGTKSGWMNRIWEQCRISMQRGRRRNSKAQSVPVAALEQRTLLAAIVVNSNLDNTTADAFTTLREAIIQAHATLDDDTITFGNGQTNFTDTIPDTITLGGTELALTSSNGSTTIIGPGANLLSISGNNASRPVTMRSCSRSITRSTSPIRSSPKCGPHQRQLPRLQLRSPPSQLRKALSAKRPPAQPSPPQRPRLQLRRRTNSLFHHSLESCDDSESRSTKPVA